MRCESALLRKDETELSGNQEQPHNGVGLFFFTVAGLSCILCQLTDSFRLYHFSPVTQALIHKHPSETRGGGGSAMFIYDKYGIVNLSSFESPFRSSCACTNVCCGFILLGPDEPGNLTVVLD